MSMTCITCRVAFVDADLQRSHYKTDWHRYNLKRKVAELQPVTAENFQERVLAQREQVKLAEQSKDLSCHCDICNKHFSSKNSFENHIQSRKHKEIEASQHEKNKRKLEAEVKKKNNKNQNKIEELPKSAKEKDEPSSGGVASGSGAASIGVQAMEEDDDDADSDAESWESWDGEALGIEQCLFCPNVADSLEKNIEHMTVRHSFFIPDIEYISDMDGLICYLGRKVGEGNICLWCNEKGKSFTSVRAVQKHMVDKGHCKMLHDGDAVFEYADFFDYRKSYPDHEEAQDTAMATDADSDEEEADEVSPSVIEGDDFELVLPSGVSVGHRLLQRYYRQKLKPDRPVSMTPVNKVLAQYRALGWTGTTGPDTKKRAKDIGFVQRMSKKHWMEIGCRANKLQTHFRIQQLGSG